ncbi:hypothetical protein KBI33_00895 [Candidatus Shapirobacteria bacterium]|nr:hypothetical protein [Candidatus Shapirobacteria bacterium]
MKWWSKIAKYQNFLWLGLFLTANVVLLLPVLGRDQFFPSHDDTWIIRLQQFDRAIKLEQIPPRLAPDMAFGFGYPLFVYYSPLFTFLSWLFLKIVGSYSLAVVLTIVLVNFLGTWGMFLLAKKFFGLAGGLVAALAFTFLPYRALDVYVRGAFAELTAFSLLPFFFYFFFGLFSGEKRKKNALGLVLTTVGLVLSHNLMLIILAYLSLPLLILAFWQLFRQRLPWRWPILVIFLVLFLSAFYWLPMIVGLDNVQAINQAQKTSFADHFVYLGQLWNWPWGFGGSDIGLADGMSFKIGKVHLLLALGGLLALFLGKKWPKEIICLLIIGFLSFFFCLSSSSFFWKNLPYLAVVQFPWRFLGPLSLVVSFFAGGIILLPEAIHFLKFPAILKKFGMGLIILVSISGLIYFNLKYFVPRFKIYQADEVYLTPERIAQAAKVIPEYLPRWASSWPEEKPVQAVEVEKGKVKISLDSPYKIIFKVEEEKPESIVVNRFYFPGWQAKSGSGEKISLGPEEGRGRIVFASEVEKDEEISVFFAPTLVEKISIGLSVLGLVLLLLVVFY